MTSRRPAPTRWVSLLGGIVLLAGCAGRGPSTQVASGATAPAPTVTTVTTATIPPTTTVLGPTTTRPAPTAASPTSSPVPTVPRPTTVPSTGPARVIPRGPYTDWNWPAPGSPSAYTAQELDVTVLTDPGPGTPYFFAHQFGFENGVGGYLGLQTLGRRVPEEGGPQGKIALFSIFAGCDDRAATSGCPRPLPLIGASAQPGLLNGSFCAPLTSASGSAAEGPGGTCRIPFEWREGVSYGLQVVLSAPDQWEARVVDRSTGAVTVIGRILVPAGWGGLSTFSVSWIEYYGDTGALTSCGQIPFVGVRWDGARGTVSTPGGLLGLTPTTRAVGVTSLHNHLAVGTGLCPNSSITDVGPAGSAVVHAIGGP